MQKGTTALKKPIHKIPRLQRSGVIRFDGSLCMTCRQCEVSCSLYHEGECNPSLSRIRIQYDDFTPGDPIAFICKQCDWPACYFACASLWNEPALYIDEATGARYIDPQRCKGCSACLNACPLTPEHSVINAKKLENKKIYFKCDLCYDRPEGPVCVDICPSEALKYIPFGDRSK